jgi:UDP-N-acetylmuramoyl-tripeptide--D-alanyl-D-alanine ligase
LRAFSAEKGAWVSQEVVINSDEDDRYLVDTNVALVVQPGQNFLRAFSGSASWTGRSWQVMATTPAGALVFALNVAGRHNVKNALAAAACALAAGVPLAAIAAGLTTFVPVKGRSRAWQLSLAGQPLTVVDDSYNANPDSVRAAIQVLSELPGPRLLVLGDMGEVGERGPEFHAEIGAYAKACGIEQLVCTGVLMQHAAAACPGARHHADFEALLQDVRQHLPGCASALVKGSRFMKMERVLEDMQQQAAAASQPLSSAPKEKAC